MLATLARLAFGATAGEVRHPWLGQAVLQRVPKAVDLREVVGSDHRTVPPVSMLLRAT